MEIFLGGLVLVGVAMVCRFWSVPEPVVPPPCRMCGHPGPFGELAPGVACCPPCREVVQREVAEVLGLAAQPDCWCCPPGSFVEVASMAEARRMR